MQQALIEATGIRHERSRIGDRGEAGSRAYTAMWSGNGATSGLVWWKFRSQCVSRLETGQPESRAFVNTVDSIVIAGFCSAIILPRPDCSARYRPSLPWVFKRAGDPTLGCAMETERSLSATHDLQETLSSGRLSAAAGAGKPVGVTE